MEHELHRALSSQGLKRIQGDTYSVDLPTDEDGRLGRECYLPNCSPAYFKIKPGTGIAEGQVEAYCPYCRAPEEPGRFFTEEQKRYFTDKLEHATDFALGSMIKNAFRGLERPSRGGFLSISVKVDEPRMRYARRPFEEELQRVVICPKCGLDHAVFGLAVWCPDCGTDIFLTHVEAELRAVTAMLSDVERRRGVLGARVAARDIENCLEDVVSIFEAVGKALLARHLRERGTGKEEVEELIRKKVGNAFQSIKRAQEVTKEHAGLELLDGIDAPIADALRVTFEKRHPITHNLGVVDRKYLEKAMSAGREGRDVRVSVEEVVEAIKGTMVVLSGLHARLFSTSGGPTAK